jgi:hypothetical protein
MERYCSTGQSPQRAIASTEEEEEEEPDSKSKSRFSSSENDVM